MGKKGMWIVGVRAILVLIGTCYKTLGIYESKFYKLLSYTMYLI